VGGGIREIATIDGYLKAGVDQVIIGTRAVREPEFLTRACAAFPHRVLLGLDARDGMIATDGWEATSNESAATFAKRVAHLPLAGIVYTDIARDGMGSGLNIAATIDLAEQSGIAVIASGGVRDLDHLRELGHAAHASRGKILGVITGRALYEGTLDLRSAQALLH
jgi:phosphoribosylformimino-5-aminoimidazole carboxamide ribotide isomerase